MVMIMLPGLGPYRGWLRGGLKSGNCRRALVAIFDYDVVIIGSGFGGSVAALRAAGRARSTAMSAATMQNRRA
jgi:hypothetical protein